MLRCKCVRCGVQFEPEICTVTGLMEQTKLCYYCFEEALEEYEERKRERIARENEY